MTASHMTHSRGTKRSKTSVPDWSMQASAESRRERNYVTKVGKDVEIKMHCDTQPDCNAATPRARPKGGKRRRRVAHIIVISYNSDCTSYATRHGLGDYHVVSPLGQDAIQTILQRFQERHGGMCGKKTGGRR